MRKINLFYLYGFIFLNWTCCLPLPLHATTVDAIDQSKVLRCVFPAAETGFDPAASHDSYSAQVIQSVFETLYTFDYLARPVKLIPQTAESLPEITNQGKTYTIKLKQGIYFAQDPAFNGRPHELTMADYIYSFERLMDPTIRSPHAWLFEGKVLGLDAAAQRAKSTGYFNYDSKVAGFELLDRYTLRINLTQPDFNLGQILAYHPTGAVARKVVDKYRDAQGHIDENPVGTGPYRLTQWVRASRLVLESRPDYRRLLWNFRPGSDPEDQHIAAQMMGKRIPQIDRIEISIMPEDQARWLSFQNDEIDLFQLFGPLAPLALKDGKLIPEFVKKGIQISRIVEPELSYHYWNMQDPIVGGLSKEKIALRRAIAMAYNVKEEINVVWSDEAIALEYPIPPGVVGHDANYKSIIRYDPAAANALLDKFSYKKGPNGWRTLPNGKPLQIQYAALASSLGKLQSEMWKRALDAISIQMVSDLRPSAELLKAAKQCKLQMRTAAWSADYPDGDNFMQLFYGPNIGQSNNGCTKIPEYDALYQLTQKIPAGPERDALYHKMTRILEVNTSQFLGYARYTNMLTQARVIGYKKHPILATEWMYFDIEKRKHKITSPPNLNLAK